MGIEIKREVTVKTKDGQTIVLASDEAASAQTFLTVTCDGPRCEARNGKRTVVSWQEEEVQKNPEIMPEALVRFIKMVVQGTPDPLQLSFCGPQCGKDWLVYSYVPPKTLKEQLASISVSEVPINPTIQKTDLHASVQESEIAQAQINDFSGEPNEQN